jgi:hypothetical protein
MRPAVTIGVCIASVMVVIYLTSEIAAPNELLVLGPLGATNFGFVLGLNGPNSVLAQLQYNHLNRELEAAKHVEFQQKHRAKARQSSIQESTPAVFRSTKRTAREALGRMQQLSSKSDLDPDDPKYSNRVWRHQEPENNTFADLEVRLASCRNRSGFNINVHSSGSWICVERFERGRKCSRRPRLLSAR